MAIQGTQIQKDNLDSMMTVVEKEWNEKNNENVKETTTMLHTLFTNRNTFYVHAPDTSLFCKLYILLKYGAI